MTTVLRLAGPLLAWPAPARFRDRPTNRVPTFAAVTGLISAAAGIRRNDERPAWISNLRAAFRIDQPGSVLRDFHSINPRPARPYAWMSPDDFKEYVQPTLRKARGAPHLQPHLSTRHYMQDQAVVAFVDDPTGNITEALTNPRFTLYAGRKSCLLAWPFLLGTTSLPIPDAARTVKTRDTGHRPPSTLEVIYTYDPEDPAARAWTDPGANPAGPVGTTYTDRPMWSTLVPHPGTGPSWLDIAKDLPT